MIKTEEEFWKYVEEHPSMGVVFDIIDVLLKESEKAYPLLPDNVVDFVIFGVSRTKEWMFAYYLPEEKCIKLFDKRFNDWVRYYERLWDAYECLSSNFVEPPPVIPEILQKARGTIYLLYTPTSVREIFEETRDKLADCESLECIVEKLDSES